MQNITHTPCVPPSLNDFYDSTIYVPSCLCISQYEFVFYVIFMFIIILGFVAFRFCAYFCPSAWLLFYSRLFMAEADSFVSYINKFENVLYYNLIIIWAGCIKIKRKINGNLQCYIKFNGSINQ